MNNWTKLEIPIEVILVLASLVLALIVLGDAKWTI